MVGPQRVLMQINNKNMQLHHGFADNIVLSNLIGRDKLLPVSVIVRGILRPRL